jgi:hypothetical protein
MTSTKNLCMLFGIAFVVAGVLGFFPNPLVGPNGIFATNRLHDYFHIGTGAVFLLGAVTAPSTAGLALRVAGPAYALIAAAGFFMMKGDALFGLRMNMADHWLHAALAAVLLIAGFGLARAEPTAA